MTFLGISRPSEGVWAAAVTALAPTTTTARTIRVSIIGGMQVGYRTAGRMKKRPPEPFWWPRQIGVRDSLAQPPKSLHTSLLLRQESPVWRDFGGCARESRTPI